MVPHISSLFGAAVQDLKENQWGTSFYDLSRVLEAHQACGFKDDRLWSTRLSVMPKFSGDQNSLRPYCGGLPGPANVGSLVGAWT